MEKAKKFNEGKPRVELIVPEFLEALGNVLAKGAIKYDDDNFKKGIPYRDSIGSILRHVYKFMRKEDYDEEMGEHHLICAAANCMMLYYNFLYNKEKDNR